ncbi:hypothetical protein L1049_004931 [Liquidambar formosana]|uniref:Uncharacterized protein n=1 Tax=Liquidambar formosana TaxID=63359 RepID=A0AAP0RU79_LIQFO
MDPEHVVFEISSDEEVSSGEPKSDDFDWISELLSEVNRERDDSDDVVVLREVNPPKQRLKSSSAVKSSSKDDDDDDDCVVLDGDPDNPVSMVNDAASGEDELLIVGEKGQIACKDFSHSRHDCANFPFSSTPHEKHCDMCHCYVCDLPAPCAHWGTGISSVDHCHATAKEEIWKLERKRIKLGNSAPLPLSKFPDTMALPQLNQVSSFTQMEVNPRPQIQVSRPTTIRACSSSTNFGIPNIISQARSQRSGSVLPKNKFQSHLVSQQLLGLRNNAVRRDRGHNVGTLGPQFVSSRTMFKRASPVGGAYPVNRSGYGSANNINRAYASQYPRNLPPMATSIDKNPAKWQDSHSSMNLESDAYQRSQPNVGSIFTNTVPTQPPLYSPPLLQSNDSQNIYQHGVQTQNATDSGFSDFGVGWVNNDSQSNQQPQVEHTLLQSAEPTKEPSLVTEFNSQFLGSVNPNSLYFDFEDLLLENQTVPGVSEASVPPESNNLSSEPAPIDTGMLYFDFETSWNGLTHWA